MQRRCFQGMKRALDASGPLKALAVTYSLGAAELNLMESSGLSKCVYLGRLKVTKLTEGTWCWTLPSAK
jgi:hypothetical protein